MIAIDDAHRRGPVSMLSVRRRFALPITLLLVAACSESGPTCLPKDSWWVQDRESLLTPVITSSAGEADSSVQLGDATVAGDIHIILDTSIGMGGYVRQDDQAPVNPTYGPILESLAEAAQLQARTDGANFYVFVGPQQLERRSYDVLYEAAAPCAGICYPVPVYDQGTTHVAEVIADLQTGVSVRNGAAVDLDGARSDVAVIITDLLHDDDRTPGSAAAFGQALASHIQAGRTVALVGVRSWFRGPIWDALGGPYEGPNRGGPAGTRVPPFYAGWFPFYFLIIGDHASVRDLVEDLRPDLERFSQTYATDNQPLYHIEIFSNRVGSTLDPTAFLGEQIVPAIAAPGLLSVPDLRDHQFRFPVIDQTDTFWAAYAFDIPALSEQGEQYTLVPPDNNAPDDADAASYRLWVLENPEECPEGNWTGRTPDRAWVDLTDRYQSADLVDIIDVSQDSDLIEYNLGSPPPDAQVIAVQAGEDGWEFFTHRRIYYIETELHFRGSSTVGVPEWVGGWTLRSSSDLRRIEDEIRQGRTNFMPTSGLNRMISAMLNATDAVEVEAVTRSVFFAFSFER